MGHRVVLIIIGLLCCFDEQTEGGPWVFTADLKKSSIDLEVEIDLGLVKESDSEASRIKGSWIAELEPDKDPKTIRITHVDLQPTKSNLQLNYSFGPFGLLGKAKISMKSINILLAPEDAGEAVELDDDGRFIQVGNIPTMSGLVDYDVNVTVLENKGEIDLSDPEQVPDGGVVEPFDIDGQLVWNGDVPVLQFDFDIEQEVTSEEFEGVTVLVLAKGTFIASGEILKKKRPELFIEPEDGGGISLSWESGEYILESSSEPAFINPEIIELDKGQTEHVTKPSLDHPQRFFRLRNATKKS